MNEMRFLGILVALAIGAALTDHGTLAAVLLGALCGVLALHMLEDFGLLKIERKSS